MYVSSAPANIYNARRWKEGFKIHEGEQFPAYSLGANKRRFVFEMAFPAKGGSLFIDHRDISPERTLVFSIFCWCTAPPRVWQGGWWVDTPMNPDGICGIDPPDGLAGWSEVINKIQEVSRLVPEVWRK